MWTSLNAVKTVQKGAATEDYIRAVMNIAGSERIDRAVGIDEFDVLTAAKSREHLQIEGMSNSSALRFRDKLRMRRVASAEKIPCPEFSGVFNADEINNFLDSVPASWIIKILTLFMVSKKVLQAHSSEILEHHLNQYFPELLRFESIKETEKSAVYQKIKPDVERILNAVVQENFASEIFEKSETIKALAWNIERGNRFEGIADKLKNHPQLKDRDALLLTELDYGMARSGNRFVARELARELEMNYAFAPIYIALQKGSGVEEFAAGENTKSLHGLSIFSKFPIENAHTVALPNGKDKMRGKEKRLGFLRALIADVRHPAGNFRAVTLHLDAHSSRKHRRLQMRIVLEHLGKLSPLPTIIGGDWNTTTYNAQNSTRAILGYWRRVMMGIRNVARNHFPHPDRYFEKGLFQELTRRGYDYKNLNEEGAGTLHYDMDNIASNTNLRDWVPAWCFPFIFWAAKQVGGRVSVRLDWFAGKGIKADGKPHTIGNLKDAKNVPLSDHDAITLDFTPLKS